jgi:hypothetical protein
MNTISFKKLFPLLLAPVFLLSFSYKPAPINFSGSWKLNEGKSELGDFGARGAAKSIKVEQKDDAITINRVSTNRNGEETTRTETLTFDGKATESTGGFGNSKRKSTAKWSDDGKTLVVSYTITFDRNGETTEISGTETWTESDDGQTITLKTHSSGGRGDINTTAVYDKQS